MDGDLAKYQMDISGVVDTIIGSYSSIKDSRNRVNVIVNTRKTLTTEIAKNVEEPELVN